MQHSIIPETYEAWQHCIVVECGLKLTPQYIAERIAALENIKDSHTQQFVKLYGPEHHKRVLSWFMQAQKACHAVTSQ